MSVYDSDDAAMLSRAYENAWQTFMKSGATISSDLYNAREFLSKKVIELANGGERDEAQLARFAFESLQQQEAGHATLVRNARMTLYDADRH